MFPSKRLYIAKSDLGRRAYIASEMKMGKSNKFYRIVRKICKLLEKVNYFQI